jgi:hypothetical protein
MFRVAAVLLLAPVLIAGPGPSPAQGPAVEGAPPAWLPGPGESPSPVEPVPEPPAWFVNAELGVLRPTVRFDPAIGGHADLGWALSPRVELGHFFGDGGAIRLGYRYLGSHGTGAEPLEVAAPALGTETDRTFLEAHWIDLDYVSRVFAPTACGRLQWEVGPRVVGRYLKIQADAPFGVLTDPTSFWGVGPYAGVDLWYLCRSPGLALFCHLDAAATFGTDRARVAGTLGVPGGPFGQFPMSVNLSAHRTEAEVELNAEVGLGWFHSFAASCVRLKAGVQVEDWFLNGKSNPGFFPYKGLGTVGPFVRCEFLF